MRNLSIFALIFFSASLAAGDSVDKWIVIGTVGKWHRTDNNSPVVIGMALSYPTMVQISPASAETGSLTILAGDTPKTFACDDPESLPDKSNAGCVHPIAIPPDTPQTEGTVALLFRQVRQLITSDSTRYYTAASRDRGSLTDSVVKVTGHSVDLLPVLSALNKGDYRLTSEKLSGSASSPVSANGTLSLHWDPEAKMPTPGPDLSPGLYHISAQSADGDSVGDAWVLIVAPDVYDSKLASFKAVKKQTDSWNQNVPATTVQAVTRAALDQLSH